MKTVKFAKQIPLSFLNSSGRFTPGRSRTASTGALTALIGSSDSTKIENGLPGMGCPSFFTVRKCSPGSLGTNETPMASSGYLISRTLSSTLLFGRRNVAVSLSKSSGLRPFTLLRSTSAGWPDENRSPRRGACTMTLNGLFWTCLPRFLMLIKCSPETRKKILLSHHLSQCVRLWMQVIKS